MTQQYKLARRRMQFNVQQRGLSAEMIMSMKSGGPAFPHEVVNNSTVDIHVYGEVIPSGKTASFHGMALRDYFAAKALQGMLSNQGMWDLVNEKHAESVAKDAYQVADAMLRAREAS